MEEIKLDPKQIVEKNFKVSTRGYNRKEVDAFLDQIIQDYEAYEKNIAELTVQTQDLTKQLQQTPATSPEPTATPDPVTTTPMMSNHSGDVDEAALPGTTNYDILKRLSNLERHVFGQSNPKQTIKNDYYTQDDTNPLNSDL
ncbi:cell division regulator GpsB [Bombilactobacillus apium]|nr:cell division regulator GpsB [Bombilactobacillus apium]